VKFIVFSCEGKNAKKNIEKTEREPELETGIETEECIHGPAAAEKRSLCFMNTASLG
jgi:hypothetical protein